VDVHGTEVTEAVTEIAWTADPGAGIAPGEYQAFSISAGPIPEVDSLVFPTIQTYDDGMESAWIEPTVEGQEEPESPAPVLALTGAAAADGDAADSTTTPASATDSGPDSDATAADDDGSGLAVTALVVGALGLVLGAAGLGLGLSARRRGA
ncbi:MAG TPA: DUF1775 domain-containing protein, partial [Blastococcus sp.]